MLESIVAAVTIFVTLSGLVTFLHWAWTIFRTRPRELSAVISYLEEKGDLRTPDRSSELSDGGLLSAKIRYYGGASSALSASSIFRCIAAGLAVDRTKYTEALRIISREKSKRFFHLEVVGDPCSGLTSMLAFLALRLREENPETVLWLETNHVDDSLDWSKLGDFRRLKKGRRWQSGNVTRFVVVVDNFIPQAVFSEDQAVREHTYEQRRRFLDWLKKRATSSTGLPVFIITSSRESIKFRDPDSLTLRLELTEKDEERILHKLAADPPALITEGEFLNLQDIWGELGGERQYKNSLEIFLSHVVRRIDHDDYIAETSQFLDMEGLEGINLQAVKHIAACQTLDVDVPLRVLILALPNLSVSELETASGGHVRKIGNTLRLCAPYIASLILSRHFGIDRFDSLLNVFQALLEPWLKVGTSEWRDPDVESFRHILQRLSRQGRFLFLSAEDGVTLANRLLQLAGKDLIGFVLAKGDTDLLCRWALTFGRLNQTSLLRDMVRRTLDVQRQQGPILNMQSFVTFAASLTKLDDKESDTQTLQSDGLSVLSLERLLLGQEQESPPDEIAHRPNEAITAYCRLLLALKRHDQILDALDRAIQLRPDLQLDAINVLTRAKTLAHFGRREAEREYLRSIALAKEQNQSSPGTVVECGWEFAKYRKRHKTIDVVLAEDYLKLLRDLGGWNLGWSSNKKKAVILDAFYFLLDAPAALQTQYQSPLLAECYKVLVRSLAPFDPSSTDNQSSHSVLDISDSLCNRAKKVLERGRSADEVARALDLSIEWVRYYLLATPQDGYVAEKWSWRLLNRRRGYDFYRVPRHNDRIRRIIGTLEEVCRRAPQNVGAESALHGSRPVTNLLRRPAVPVPLREIGL